MSGTAKRPSAISGLRKELRMNKGAFDEIKLRFSKKDMSFIPKDGKKRRRLLLILAVVIVGAYIVFSSVYMVNDQEKAVITTF